MKDGKEGVVREIMMGSPVTVAPPPAIREVARFIPISATLMAKLSKHLAFLACLMILARASGRAEIGQFAIFILVAFAALAQGAERTLRRRLRIRFPSRET